MIDLKIFRKDNKMTQSDAANYFGCTQAFISQIEKKIRPIPEEFISKIKADQSINKSALIDNDKSDQNENTNDCQMNPENIPASELMKALNNVSEAAKINAIANERNSRNMEKMLEMIEAKDKQNDKKGDASPKALKQDDAAHIVSSPPVGSKK